MITAWLLRVRTVTQRATAGPLLVRGGIFLTALGALLTAYPAVLVASQLAVLLAIAAVLPAVLPRGIWPLLTMVIAVAGWLVSTMGYQEPVGLLRVFAIAGLGYLTHSLAALAAALPYVDTFLAGNNFESLEELARAIARAAGRDA